MNRLSLTSALCLALAGPLAFAQAPQAPSDAQQPPAPIVRPHRGDYAGPRHQPDAHKQAMMLSRRLNLTPDQTARIEPVLADRQQKMAALHANTSLTPEQTREQMRSLHEQERTQFASILTPEQQEQMKAMRHGRRGGQFRGQPGPNPGAPAPQGTL